MKPIYLAYAVSLSLLPAFAWASNQASDTARWMPPEAVAQRLLDVGFSEVRRVEPDGTHYAVSAVGPDGVQVGFHADPATGDLVHNTSSAAEKEGHGDRDEDGDDD